MANGALIVAHATFTSVLVVLSAPVGNAGFSAPANTFVASARLSCRLNPLRFTPLALIFTLPLAGL